MYECIILRIILYRYWTFKRNKEIWYSVIINWWKKKKKFLISKTNWFRKKFKNNNQEFVINNKFSWYTYIILEIRLIECWSSKFGINFYFSKFDISSYPCEFAACRDNRLFVITTSKLTIQSRISGPDPITRVPRTIAYYCVILEPNLSSVSIPWDLTNHPSNATYAIAVNNLGILRLTNVWWWCTVDCQKCFRLMYIDILLTRYLIFFICIFSSAEIIANCWKLL